MQQNSVRDFFENVVGVSSQKVLDVVEKHAIVWHADKGEVIVHKGNQRKEISWLMQGAVKWYDYDIKGNEKIICLDYFPASRFPLIIGADISSDARESHSCVTVVDSTLVSCPYPVFLKLLEDFGAELNSLIQDLMKEGFDSSTEMTRVYGDYSATEKILWVRRRYPELTTFFSNRDIARYLRITPETYSRTINKLKKENEG